MPSSHLILCRPLLLLPPIPPIIRVFSSESTLRVRWPKYWSFSFNISPSNEHPGLISFRMDCLDLLAVQGTLKNLLQHHSSKASILPCSSFFTVQVSHPYMTTGKTIALMRWTFFGKVMSLLFNMLFRLVITFLPRSKHLLISWLQSPSIRIWYTFYGLISEIFIYEINKHKRKAGLFDFQNDLDNININIKYLEQCIISFLFPVHQSLNCFIFSPLRILLLTAACCRLFANIMTLKSL